MKSEQANPLRSILAEFDRVNLVGLGERHSSVADSEFRLKLIRDPEFSRKVTDIVVEFADPQYQAILDRYVNGEHLPPAETDVPKSKLKVWQQWNGNLHSPIYEEFIDTVRAVNFGLPAGQKLRVVADGHKTGDVIRKEVLDKHHKALVIFGDHHFLRNKPDSHINRLKDDPRATWFAVASAGGSDVPAAIASYPATPSNPVLIPSQGVVGRIYAGYLMLDYNHGWDPSPNRVTLGEVIDALLYYGSGPVGYRFKAGPVVYRSR